MEIKTENIPGDLMKLHQWVAWNGEKRKNGKTGKIPINPSTGRYADTSDCDTWGSFEDALNCFQEHNLQGIGFVFTEDDHFTGIDLDNCFNPDKGEFEPWAEKLLNRFNSYTEITPSGKGFHIIMKGTLPGPGRKNDLIEIYDRSRFFNVTGNNNAGYQTHIASKEDEVCQFYNQKFSASVPSREDKQTDLNHGDHSELIGKALGAPNGEKFERLLNGDCSGYPSQSEADLAFCQILAYWTDNAPEQINDIFRQSGLYRSKWDEKHGSYGTYGKMTIQKAIGTYQPLEPALVEKKQTGMHFKTTDLGNGERLAHIYGEDIRYCHAWKSWLIWDGPCWSRDQTDEICRKAKNVVRGIYREAELVSDSQDRTDIAKHAIRSESDSRLRAMITLAKSERDIPVKPEQLDSDPWLFTCLNGTIDLKTGKLLPHNRDHLITQLAPVKYDSDATCPTWDAFLHRIMAENDNLISFLQRMIGYSLTGDTGEQCLFILYGSGANGKSTFLQAVSSMCGDYSQQTPTETLLVKKKGSIPNDVARLKGARLVTASEAEEGQRLAESLIKQMTGQDILSARFLHQEWFEFEPTHKIFLGTNHKPVIKGTDHAIWRRIKLIPFDVTIPEEERDNRLLSKLRDELPGILSWAVKGCLDWQRHGLGEPPEVKSATQDYRSEMDALAQFRADCCIEDPGAKVAVGKLYDAYTAWCEINGEQQLGKRAFSMKTKEAGFKQVRFGKGRTRGFQGIGIVENG